jgi:zinc/manganese transport system substrate-binding protein
MKIKNGSNPHIWYIPETMPIYAKKLAEDLSQLDALHRDYFQAQLKKFNQSSQQIIEKVNYLKQKFNNTPYIATEPVFYYMADAIGLKNHGEGFQLSMMNDVPPSFSEVKQFENDLRQHAVNVFIFNDQVINPSAQKMLSIAQQENIPVVGVSETMPINLHYVQWIMHELNQLENALKKSEGNHRDKT